jgi:hypothetical protein
MSRARRAEEARHEHVEREGDDDAPDARAAERSHVARRARWDEGRWLRCHCVISRVAARP